MPIADSYKANFKTLLRAGKNGALAIVECFDAKTKQPVITICAIGVVDAHGNHGMTPLAKLFDGNPYEELIPPTPLNSPSKVDRT